MDKSTHICHYVTSIIINYANRTTSWGESKKNSLLLVFEYIQVIIGLSHIMSIFASGFNIVSMVMLAMLALMQRICPVPLLCVRVAIDTILGKGPFTSSVCGHFV